MEFKEKLVAVLIAAAMLIVGLVSCGGSGSSTTGSSAAEGSTSAESTAEANAKAKAKFAHSKSKIPNWGQEADAAEREAASLVLEKNLKARAAGDWEGQCATLTVKQTKAFAERATYYKVGKTCAKGLEHEAEGVSKSVLADTMTGPVDVLRIKGNDAYALYVGKGGKAYAMPMVREGDEWRVDDVVTTEIPQ